MSWGLLNYRPMPAPLWAVVMGVVVAQVTTLLESALLPENDTTLETLQRRSIRWLLKWNILLRYHLARAIEYCREQDAYDLQHPYVWGFDLDKSEVGRRIRMLYERHKYEIARKRRDPSFLTFDLGRVPPDQFYLLVRHLGRERVRDYVRNPVTYFPGWDGKERRRRVGTREERDTSAGTASSQSRISDDPEVIERIKSG